MPLHFLLIRPYPNRDAFTELFKQELQANTYQLYDPFGVLPGKTYRNTVKLFIAPPHSNDWLSLISEQELSAWLPALGTNGIALMIKAQAVQVQFYREGYACSPADFVKMFPVETSLEQVLEQYEVVQHPTIDPTPPPTVVPLTLLPSDVQAMAGNLSNQQINTLFEKLTRQLPQEGVVAEAQQFVHEQVTLNWTSPYGKSVRRLMSTLGTPDASILPPFTTIRDVYHVHRQLQRRPYRTLLPGEDNLRQLIPNALDYQPIYAGRND